jgi:hypothetical protein
MSRLVRGEKSLPGSSICQPKGALALAKGAGNWAAISLSEQGHWISSVGFARGARIQSDGSRCPAVKSRENGKWKC